MGTIAQKIKDEFYNVLAPTLFFFGMFSLLIVTKTLILMEYEIEFSGFAKAAVGALLVGKLVLILDKVPFVNRFPHPPLIYNVLWKTGLYVLVALLIHYGGEFIPLLSEHGNMIDAYRHLRDQIVWPRFWVLQIWLSVLFFFFFWIRELVRALGHEKVTRLFFGWPTDTRPR